MRIHLALGLALLASFAGAQSLKGTVKNSTTGKPSSGDEVVVFSLDRGMKESGRTTTDALGHFSFKLDGAQAPHLIRVTHQGVTYHRVASTRTTSVALEVYDVANQVKGIGVIADIMRIQASGGQIAVTRDFGVRNASNPPRTLMNDRSLEFYIPDGAQIIENSGTAIPENSAPVQSSPVPAGDKNRYSFVFPLRPGLTHFEVTYFIPYSGKASLDPKSIYPLEHFLVLLPKSMQFKPAVGSAAFKVIQSATVPNATAQVASNTKGGQSLAFNISGEGTLETSRQASPQDPGQHQERSMTGAAIFAHSGNSLSRGVAPPIGAADPLQTYRWWILGASVAVLVIGCVYVARQQSRLRFHLRREGSCSLPGGSVEAGVCGTMESSLANPQFTPAGGRGRSGLIAGIKEELFRIEVERKLGQISEREFEKVRAALDQTLDLALKREANTAEAHEKLVTL